VLRAAKRNDGEDKRNASSATQGNGEVHQVNGTGGPS